MTISYELYERIRKLYLVEKRSQREISRLLGISRPTIRKYVYGAIPPSDDSQHEQNELKSSLKKTVEPFITKCLEENKNLPRKQQMNAQNIWEFLCKEKGFKLGKSTVRRYIRQIKGKRPEIFVPLIFDPGEAMQVDWGEAYAYLGTKKRKFSFFGSILCNSQGINASVFPDASMESFYMGHINAFKFFEGVPLKCIYDNLKTAVLTGGGKNAVVQERFKKIIAHYGFEAIFCNIRSPNEKGLIENLVSTIRSIAFTPIPRVKDFTQLQDLVTRRCVEYCESHHIKKNKESIKVMLEKEKKHLLPLPLVHMNPAKTVIAKVHSDLTVYYKKVKYSVPAFLAGKKVTLKVTPFNVSICYQGKLIYQHKKAENEYDHQYIPEHYLEVLEQKPRAIDNALPLKQGVMPEELMEFRKLCKHKDKNHQLVSLLLLGKKVPKKNLLWAVNMANRGGNPDFGLVSFYLKIQNASNESDVINHYPVETKSVDMSQYDKIMMGVKKNEEI